MNQIQYKYLFSDQTPVEVNIVGKMIVDHRETFVINLTMTCRHQTQKLDNDAITIKVLQEQMAAPVSYHRISSIVRLIAQEKFSHHDTIFYIT